MPSPSLETILGGSGKVFHVRAKDSNGDLSNLTAFSTNSSQLVHVHAATGSWTATLSGHTSAGIPVGALAATVQTALEGISGVGSGQVVVTGDGPTRLVAWQGTLAGMAVPLLTFSTAGLSSIASPSPTTAGSTAEDVTDATIGASFSKLGTWTGTNASRRAVAAGDGRIQAEWSIAGLAQGTYQIFSGMTTSGSGNAPLVPFRFFDGTTPRGLVQVNQQAQPLFVTFPDGAGAGFYPIRTAYVTSGNALRVLITDEGVTAGKQIEAASIAVVPIDLGLPIVDQIVDTPAYVTTSGTWTGESKPGTWNGTSYYTQTPGGTYTWLFPGLLPGTYSPQVAFYQPGTGWSNLASYQLYADDVAVGSPVVVNQNTAPMDGLTVNDTHANAIPFHKLTNLTTTTGNIKIVLTCGTDVPSPQFGTLAGPALVSLILASGYTESVSATGEVFAGGPPSIRVNGGSPVLLTTPNFDPAGLSPLMNFPLASTLNSADVVTFTAPANSFACAAGSLPAITNQAVTNCTGGSVGPTGTSSTMVVGYNLLNSGIVPFSSNLFLNQQPLPFSDAIPGTSLGYPQSIIATYYFFIHGGEAANAVDAKTYPGLLAGTYTYTFDGARGGEIRPVPAAGTTMVFGSIDTGHAIGNTITFNLSISDTVTYYAPSFISYFYLNQGFIDDADTGRCSSTGTWVTASSTTAWNGGYHLSDNSPSSVWTWTLGTLPGGLYLFAAHWKGLPGNTTQARYTIKQAGIELTHFDVDQTADPASSADMQGSDLNGRTLHFRPNGTTATTTGGLITIELHTVNGDGVCSADAVGYKLSGNLTSGTPFQPIANAVLHGPEITSPTSAPEFNPLSTAALGNAKCLRAMRMQSAIYGAFSEITDYAQEGQLTYQGNSARPFRYNITKIENDANADGFWLRTTDTVNGPYDGSVLVTVSAINGAPLPIIDRTPFLFPAGANPVYSISGGEFNININQVVHRAAGHASNQFSVGNHIAGNYGLGGDTLTTLNITPGDAIGYQDFTSIPRAVYYRRVASISGCAAWVNPTLTWSDAAIQAECALYLAIMPAGSRLIWEPGNEPWNTRFPGYWACDGYARVNGLDGYTQGYAAIAAHQHAVATTALGSRSGELIRAFGCVGVSSGTYLGVINYCAGIGAPVDLILISNYVNIEPQQIAGLDSLYAGLTAAQIVDCGDATLHLYGQTTAMFAAVQAACVAASTGGHTVHWGLYEAQTLFGMGGTQLQMQTQAYAAPFHPLEYVCKLTNFALAQQYGAIVMAIYSFDEQAFDEFQFANYGVFHSVNATNGIGDGSDGLHDNRPDIAGAPPAIPDLRTVVYPMGQAVQTWNGTGPTHPVFSVCVGLGIALGDGSASSTPAALSGARDQQILDSIAAVLDATQQFHEISVSGMPVESGDSAEILALAVLELGHARRGAGWCDPTGVSHERIVDFTLTLCFRDEDPKVIRDNIDRLFNVAANAISGVCFCGVTMPDKTYIEEGLTLRNYGNEGRRVFPGHFSYLIPSWQSHNADPP